MDMNWNFMSSSVWLNIVAARCSCSLARSAVAVAAAADVAVAVSSSMPFSRSASSSYFCSWSSSMRFLCSRENSRSLRTRVASMSAMATSKRSRACFLRLTSWKTAANSASNSCRFRSRSARFRWIAISSACESACSFRWATLPPPPPPPGAGSSAAASWSSWPSGSSVSTSGAGAPSAGASPVDGRPAAPPMRSWSTSRSCVSSRRSRSIWSISWSSRSSTLSSFSDSRSSAWMCDTRDSAFSWDRCSASISSCWRSKATFDSSINRRPSRSRSGPGSAFSQSRRRDVRRRPRWPR